MSLPIRPTRNLDVYYSKNTVYASATLFERKGEMHFFQSIDPRPVVTPASVSPISPILVLVPFAFSVASYYLTIISEEYQHIDKEFLLRWTILTGLVLLILRLMRLK